MLKLPEPTTKPSNPVFRFEMAQGRGLIQPQRLKVYSRWVVDIAVGLVIVWWTIVLFQQVDYFHHYWNNTTTPSYSLYSYIFSSYDDSAVGNLAILGIGTVLMSLIADGWYMLVTIANINRKINNSHWDLLQLTPLRRDIILDGLCAAAEVRAWPAMLLDRAARIALIAFVVLSVLMPSYWIIEILHGDSQPYPLFTSFTGSPESAVVSITLFVGLIILSIGYTIEPLWRMRLMLTVGLAVSARFHSENMAAVAGTVALLAIRLTQAVLLATTLAFIGLVSWMLISILVNASTILCLLGFFGLGFPAACGAIIMVNRAYFRWLRDNAYDRLWAWAFRIE